MVGADRVDGAVRHRRPQRLDMMPGPERGGDQEPLGVPAGVASLVEQEVVQADLGEDSGKALARARRTWSIAPAEDRCTR